MGIMRPLAKRWHRSEVRGLELIPPGGSLVVSNHSGGVIAMDVPVFAVDFYEKFGYDRPLYTLSHDLLFHTPAAELVMRIGFIPATRDNAATALRAGAVVIVFPGGPDDAYRPTAQANTIDFRGRTGYVKTALAAGVPIVPAVSIGGQESQLFLSRGTWLAHLLRLDKLARLTILPLSVGFPFGLSIGLPLNLPAPTKIVTKVLDPIDIVAQFGEDPDPVDVDNHVRSVMQNALDKLAATRRFPILG
ncbi:lysophospholipid acyltransferase family protein [Mycobacterium paraintracellulare]|uniref:lysophospholipid acyltransferase family protein n=1 Tax=Mycobacterium paraintracellulare TaxID=1138383 RepID=UPI0019265980|nr:lysophospholipid acyltransferase family protein [Mycobacterium paraintracellulare]